MPRGTPKVGLRVKYCEDVGSHHQHCPHLIDQRSADGWYVQVKRSKWYCLMDLCFVREQDAERAMEMLTRAGLDCYSALVKAGPEVVRQVACEFLQW